MASTNVTRRLYWGGETLLFAGVIAAVALTTHSSEWHPLLLFLLLLALTLAGDRLTAAIGSGELTTAHIALVLAMVLLGPGPAVAIGVSAAVLSSLSRRIPPTLWLNNLATFAVYPFAGALTALVLAGDIHDPRNHHFSQGVTFGLIVFGVFLLTIALNFAMFATEVRVEDGRSLVRQTREAFIPLLPGHLAAAFMAALFAVAYTNFGLAVLFAAILVLAIFHYLTTALLRSEERADQLEARSIHLANLQFGVLSMLMDALAMRDRSTSRHAAAVARLAKALAGELGCDEEEQEVIHTAALLHDIGKFAWSDRILHPRALTDEDWEIVRRHPQDGAALVGKLDGYGPVADAILYHHERVDGGGYPAGLIGREIPLASRIIAICSAYDTMTMSDALGPRIEPAEATQELRRASSSGQFDPELVEAFIAMLETKGDALMGEEASYETELAFTERVRKLAQPARR
jgi:putative nucleotidyltransferase with HDIG domain